MSLSLKLACAAIQDLVVKTLRRLDAGESVPFRELERSIGERAAGVELAALAMSLEGYEPKAEVVAVDGRNFRRLGESTPGKHFTLRVRTKSCAPCSKQTSSR